MFSPSPDVCCFTTPEPPPLTFLFFIADLFRPIFNLEALKLKVINPKRKILKFYILLQYFYECLQKLAVNL